VAGQTSTLTATITGGSGNYTYQWVSSNGGIFSSPAGTATAGTPITTQYLMTGAQDTIKLLITDVPCGRQSIWYTSLVDAPPTLDFDADNSTGATGADFKGYFQGGGAVVPAADTDTLVTDNGTIIQSAAIKLTTRPDGTAETKSAPVAPAFPATYDSMVCIASGFFSEIRRKTFRAFPE
jgi:hypothetical protein